MQISMSHAAALTAVNAQDRKDDERREAAREEFASKCETMAPQYQEAMEIARARAENEAFRADQERQRAQERKDADIQDYRDHLLRAGQRWHTVAEALALERGVHLG
jgi:hypothetical protein